MNKFIRALLLALYSFSSILSMPKVTSEKNTASETIYICPENNCDKFYTSQYGLNLHIKSFHKGIRYNCPYNKCKKSYAFNNGLQDHIKRVHTAQGYQCPHPRCKATYSNEQDLQTHINNDHPARKYKCTQEGCDKSYTSRHHLERHIELNHTRKNKYQCPHDNCPESYKEKSHLNEHISICHPRHRTDNNLSSTSPESNATSSSSSVNNITYSPTSATNTVDTLIFEDMPFEEIEAPSDNTTTAIEQNIEQDNNNSSDDIDDFLSPADIEHYNQQSFFTPKESSRNILAELNKALEDNNIDYARTLLNNAHSDQIKQLKSQILFSLIIQGKIELIDTLNNNS